MQEAHSDSSISGIQQIAFRWPHKSQLGLVISAYYSTQLQHGGKVIMALFRYLWLEKPGTRVKRWQLYSTHCRPLSKS